MLAVRPVSEYVLELPVLANVMKLPVQAVFLSILYPVIGVPPLLLGVAQLRLICDDDTAVASRFVGAEGTESVVAVALFDGLLTPTEFIA